MLLNQYRLFDAHFHIIDNRFPLVTNQGYLPEAFTTKQYLDRMRSYNLQGGAIVSGSFQALDQSYLLDALESLGEGFVGVTQLPSTVSEQQILRLHSAGVRAIRFNLQRGGSEGVDQLENMAKSVYEIAGWHTELYVDSSELDNLYQLLIKLPAISVDHLGLSSVGLPTLRKLAEKGVKIKATGFSRIDFDVRKAILELNAINPYALMFGTDLPSTRAPRPYADSDYQLIVETLDDQSAERVFFHNAADFYQTTLTVNNSTPATT